MAKHKTTKDRIYDYLSTKINNGNFKPKEQIDERQICIDLQVSRTPVREAFIELINEGYLEKMPRRGFRVKEITPEEIKETYSIIGVLEGYAASQAAHHLSGKDFLSLNKFVEKMDISIKKRKYRDYYKQQKEFHNIIVKAGGNQKLFTLISTLKKRFIKEGYSIHTTEEALRKELKMYNQEHKQIIKLLKNIKTEELERYLRDVHWGYRFGRLVSEIF